MVKYCINTDDIFSSDNNTLTVPPRLVPVRNHMRSAPRRKVAAITVWPWPRFQDMAGVRLRDEAIAAVALSNADWMSKALSMLEYMRGQYSETTGEQMRLWLLQRGLGLPTKPHAWGALTRTAAKRNIIMDTGRSVNMSDPKSHSRRTPVWAFR